MTVLRRAALTLCALTLLVVVVWAYSVVEDLLVVYIAVPFAVISGLGFVFAGRALGRMDERQAEILFRRCLAGMALLYIGVSLWFMHTYRYTPLWDPDAVFTGAQNWLNGLLTQGSTLTFDAQNYFYYFPNNLGATLVLRSWFACTRFIDPYISACLLNGLLSAGMIVCTGLSAKEMGGAKTGLLALLILACTLPIWFSCAAFYTDFLSIAFPVAALLFALMADKQEQLWKKALFWILAGCMVALGAMIKITVLIMPVALVLWQLVRNKWREALGLLLSCALLFSLGQYILQRSVYPDQLDPELSARMNTPILHWIAMGLRADGYYNGEDYNFTRSFADARDAKLALEELIEQRIRDRGLRGFMEHIARKMGICLSDGTLMLSDYYDDYPVSPNWLQDLLLPGGGGYHVWRAVCGGVHMAQLILALAGCIRQLRRGGNGLIGAAYVALFGLLLFLSMWETSKRYWINFLPLLVLCAADGVRRREEGATAVQQDGTHAAG